MTEEQVDRPKPGDRFGNMIVHYVNREEGLVFFERSDRVAHLFEMERVPGKSNEWQSNQQRKYREGVEKVIADRKERKSRKH